MTNSLNKRKHSIGVFIDLQKAFDTVDHQLLCTKLELYGIRGVAYQWIRSYLSNRTQYVTYEGHKSELLPIQCGVPQGSILCPLLFTIYVNDMCTVSKLLKFIVFADDTNIFHSHSKLPDLASETNTELGKMYKWFCENKLSLNIAKTNYILFGRYTHQQDAAIIINDVTIQRVQATTFLGVLTDESLNWKNHIKMVISKLSKVASVIYKVSHCIDHSSMRTLYCSLVLPHLMYCCEIWGNTYVTNIKCITLIHKRVIRLIHGASRWDHTNNLFYEYRILKFNDIVELKTIVFMFDAYHNVLSYDLQQLFVKPIPLYSARRTHQFIREKVRINMRAMFIPVLGVKLWNSLNESLVSIMSKCTFKRHYINILVGKYTM